MKDLAFKREKRIIKDLGFLNSRYQYEKSNKFQYFAFKMYNSYYWSTFLYHYAVFLLHELLNVLYSTKISIHGV